MSHKILLFEQRRWAVFQDRVQRITELAAWSEKTPPMELSAWGILEAERTSRARILHLATGGEPLSIRVSDSLTPLLVDSEQIYTLPPGFFDQSPASAVVRLSEGPPAVLLDPIKLAA